MHSPATEKSESISRSLIVKLLLCAALSLFWVIFIWHFWDKGIIALGINATLFLFLFIGVFVWNQQRQGHYIRADLVWVIPLGLVALSFALYDNPFLKIINLLVLPVALAVFYNQAYLADKKTKPWDFLFITKIIGRFFSFFTKLSQSLAGYLNIIIPAGKMRQKVITRVLIGLVLFAIIALTVFIPLLSSADTVFADKMQGIYDWLKGFISLTFMYKLLVFIIFSVLFSSVLLAWGRHFEYTDSQKPRKSVDPIIAGIVLMGILLLYILFLWIQVNRLWVGQLPFDFKETESLVKSGFWQLLFLSVINILIYFFTYRKTSPVVQKILGVFTLASLLLLVSAGYRMGLYATYYGLSYEKFFASYTVIYCTILFIWLITRLFIKQRSNILKFLVVLFLWMYAVVTVLPVEQFIMRTNVALSNLENTRIRLFEMTMLSPDVLSLVKRYEQQGVLKEKVDYLAREGENRPEEEFDWQPWIKRQERIVDDKAWYELNLTNLVTKE